MAAVLATSRTHSAAFPSPDTSPQGWSSERVPLSSLLHGRRRHAAAALMPFGSGSGSGRAFPSKWDDAERWISSPATAPNYHYATGVTNPSSSHLDYRYQRRAKSKSGPLGPAGLASYGSFSGFSPVLGMGVINGGRWRNSVAVESPASVRQRLQEEMAAGAGGFSEGGRRSCLAGKGDPDWWSGPPSPNHDQVEHSESQETIKQNDSNNSNNDHGEGVFDRIISRRDMATQMYPQCDTSNPSSIISTPRSSISDNSPLQLMPDDQIISNRNNNSRNNAVRSPDYYDPEVRDVQVDKQTSTCRRSTSDKEEFIDNPSLNASFVEADTRFSKIEKEAARINAWENLQKAKADAAIQKLEMGLEKKRASAMEKIIGRLRRSEIKAEKMRSCLSDGNSHQAQKHTTSKIPSFCRKFRFISSSKRFTTCYPF